MDSAARRLHVEIDGLIKDDLAAAAVVRHARAHEHVGAAGIGRYRQAQYDAPGVMHSAKVPPAHVRFVFSLIVEVRRHECLALPEFNSFNRVGPCAAHDCAPRCETKSMRWAPE